MTERGGNRYFTYLLIAPVKIGLFLGAMVSSPFSAFLGKSTLQYCCMPLPYNKSQFCTPWQVVIPWYSGAIQQPSDLATHFYSSFNSHQFTVAEVSFRCRSP